MVVERLDHDPRLADAERALDLPHTTRSVDTSHAL
jgi:hypothetical protein